MKLLAKTSLIYLLSTALVFLVGGLIFYYNLRNIVDEEATEHIYSEKLLIEKYVKEHDKIPVTDLMTGDLISFTAVNIPVNETISDTTLYSEEEGETLPYRCIKFPVMIDGKNYSVSISKALFESDDLVETILTSFILITLVLLLVTFIVNRIASKRLWKPFLNSLSLLNEYKIDKHQSFHFSSTSTKEFKQLNEALGKMTEKMSANYNNLKTFTENASHELQTPLSVIMTSSENMLQQKGLDETQLDNIQTIHQTARRLSRLNQTLLLLAKIENRQFENKEEIDAGKLLESKLEFYSDLIHHKEITLEKNIAQQIKLYIHPVLADVMISNLVMNAIRHNKNCGIIRVLLDKEKISICNSGEPLLSAEKLFDRFYKENSSSESTGLGLALVKQVAETNGMKIAYSFKNGMHCFEIIFSQAI
jgi:signal transduction histidine kinase